MIWSTASRLSLASPRFIAAARRDGLAVQVWTVDREDDARRLLGWGVDGLITDRPDVIVPIVAALADRPAAGSDLTPAVAKTDD